MALGRVITYHRLASRTGDLYIAVAGDRNVWEADEKQFDLSKLRLAGESLCRLRYDLRSLYSLWSC